MDRYFVSLVGPNKAYIYVYFRAANEKEARLFTSKIEDVVGLFADGKEPKFIWDKNSNEPLVK